mgnify:CR=1 FL=1
MPSTRHALGICLRKRSEIRCGGCERGVLADADIAITNIRTESTMRKETRALAAMLAPMGAEESIPLAKHTSFRIGGPADLLFAPKSREELRFAWSRPKPLTSP